MQKSFFWALVALSFSLSLVACKGNDPQPQTAQVQLQPEGGMFTLNNGVTIVVPEGAVTMPTDVQVEYLTDLDETVGNLPSDIQGRLKLTPEGLTFNKAIEVTMPLNQSVTDATLDIVYWSAQDKTWYITDRGQVANNKVTFYIEHFSDYASISSTFDPLFATMDRYVSAGATSSDITTDSPEMVNFLEEVLWEQKNFKNLVIATHADVGGQLVSVCAQCCGLFGSWMSKDTLTSEVRQSTGRFKEDSKDNIYTILGLHESQMTEHLRNQIVTEARSTVIDRSVEIRYNACPVNLRGAASPTRIEKGKTTQVTITAHCNGDPLPDQLIQFSYSPELSCEVVNKKTDASGQVTITVKGEAEGNGIVYAKAVSAAHSDDVTEIQVPVKVGGGEQWRITIDVQGRCYSSFNEKYNVPFHTTNYEYSGDEQEVKFAYTLVYDLNVQQTGAATGKVSVINYPEKFSYSAPAFSQSGDWVDQDAQIYSHAESSHTKLNASPEFRTVKDVAVVGACYVSRKMASLALSDYGVTSSMEDYDKFIHECGFLFPNASGQWMYQADDNTDNGEYFLGKLSSMEEGKNIDGHYYRNYSYLSIPAYLILENFVEMEETFEHTGESYTGTDISVTINGNEIDLPTLDNAVGHYTLYNEPAYWEGEVHTSISGTLKIEQLSQAQ